MAFEVEEDDTEEGAVVIRATSGRKKRGKKEEEAEPGLVENDEIIPLFPNLDKDPNNVVVAIRVLKRDPPGDGYKGDIHPTAGLAFVAKRWGNGIYDFHALNAEHKVLRRNDNVVIASVERAPAALPGASGMDASERLLDRQATAHERDQARADGLARETIASTREQARSYAEMIRADTEARTLRDREYFAQLAVQQREAFQQQMLQTQQLHTLTMDSQRASFSQVLQLMSAAHERELAANNPTTLLAVLQQGFQMAQQMGGPDDDPLSVAMKTGLGGLQELTKMMALQKGIKSPKLAKSNPSGKAASPPKTGEKQKPAVSRKELQEVLELKRVAEKKGYDFEGILSQAKLMVNAAPDQNDESDESDESDDNDDSEESGDAHVDGGESPK